MDYGQPRLNESDPISTWHQPIQKSINHVMRLITGKQYRISASTAHPIAKARKPGTVKNYFFQICEMDIVTGQRVRMS